MRVLVCVLAAFCSLTQLHAQANCLQGDCKNGYGVCLYPNVGKYAGDFQNGKMHGKGILYYTDGTKYIGHWADHYREGEGRMVFASGDEYLGQFVRNKMQGQGVMEFINGNRYEGNWLDSKPHGRGIFQYANGDRYEGDFFNGQRHGSGAMVYADGSRYEGEWAAGNRHGEGLLIFASGETIRGVWVDDQYQMDFARYGYAGDTATLRNCNLVNCANGKGKYAYRDGNRYIGDFYNGVPQGVGTVYYKSGDRYEGGWKQNQPHGEGIMYYVNGRVTGALWDFGKPVKKLFFEEQEKGSIVISAEQSQEVRIWAVIIGAAHYNTMPVLKYTDDDAYQLYAFMKSPEGGALPDHQITLLIDEEATRANILQSMRSVFFKADENDVVLFYFSGHGLPGAFLPIDYDGINNTLSHEEVREILKISKAKHKLVLADACHSGTLMQVKTPGYITLEKFYKAFEDTQGGTALLLSSKGEEFSLEDGGLRSGIFSHFLIRGLKGEADTDENKIVTIKELFDFVFQRVRRYTANVQTPTLSGKYDPRMPVAMVRP
ncbi:MAG: caspase family protein [Saprospiraceae bacterium]|nr:caspase family protein [Saprospiraceae bacterium]